MLEGNQRFSVILRLKDNRDWCKSSKTAGWGGKSWSYQDLVTEIRKLKLRNWMPIVEKEGEERGRGSRKKVSRVGTIS